MKAYIVITTVFFLVCLFSHTYINYLHQKIYFIYLHSNVDFTDQYSLKTHKPVSKGALREIPLYSRIMFRTYKTVEDLGPVILLLMLPIGCFVFIIYRKIITLAIGAIVFVELLLSCFFLQNIIV